MATAPDEGRGEHDDTDNQSEKNRAIIANARTGHRPKKLVTPTHLPVGPRKKHTRLLIPATIELWDGVEKNVNVFIDTGSEVNLVRKGLVPSSYFSPAKKPLELWAANAACLSGGKMEVTFNIRILVVDSVSKKKVAINTPTTLYDAATEDDITLSLLCWPKGGWMCALIGMG